MCPYETLGVEHTTSPRSVRRAYYKTARQLHPDRRGDANGMADASAAYAVLRDATRRVEHDRRERQRRMRSDVDVARGRRADPLMPKPPPAPMPRAELTLTLEQVYHGYDASGVIQDGMWVEESVAAVERGLGCKRKRSEGMSVRAVVPPGAPDGYEVPFAGGNLVVRQEPHPLFLRREGDLVMRTRITLGEALGGFARELVHLDGRRIPVASAVGDVVGPGDVRVFKGLGMYDRMTRVRGDLRVIFEVTYPPTECADYTRAGEILREARG